MGIAIGALRFLMEEGVARPWSGQVLTLGRQLTAVTAGASTRLAREAGFAARPWGDARDDNDNLSDVQLFAGLGFDRLLALDANLYEKPDIVHDLNRAEIPENLSGRFDLVFDGGTLEHVFDVASALRAVCRFTKPGGRVVHLSPLSNCVDHGFYSFSPILFRDFYAANNWIIRRLATARFEHEPASDPWEIRDYQPDDFARLGALATGTYFLLTCVESKMNSTCEAVPQQSYYTQVWDDALNLRAMQ